MAEVIKLGSEFLVNTEIMDYQISPTITSLSNGGFVVAWDDYSGTLGDSDLTSIKAQIFNVDGTKAGAEFLVNTEIAGRQLLSNIASIENGGFVVTWCDESGTLGDGDLNSIKGQVFNSSGAKVGAELLVNTETFSYQNSPAISGLANGGFVITWADFSGTLGDIDGWSIKAQVFDEQGCAQGAEFLVNTQVDGSQILSKVTGLSNGNFLISWQENTVDSQNIKAQIFSSSGEKRGEEFQVNTSPSNGQSFPVTTRLVNGGFVISWNDYSGKSFELNDISVKARIFDINGVGQGGELLVNTQIDGSQEVPAVTGIYSGGFVVTWTDYSKTLGDNDTSSVKAKLFNADGTVAGEEFLVNTQKMGGQGAPAVVNISNDHFVITWMDYSGTLGDSSGSSIKAQVFSFGTPQPSEIIGTAGNDRLIGTSVADTIKGLAGNDILDGRLGDDALIGGTGNDTYLVDSAGDKVVEKAGEGADTVKTALAKYTLGLNLENLTFIDSAAHAGVGNEAANRIIGGAGNDRLDGRGGADRLEGGAGNDTYVVNVTGDRVIEAPGAGTDTLIASVSFTLAANVEKLTLSGTSAINGTGNVGGNTITGNSAENILKGFGGNDRLMGGGGNDTLYGGIGRDLLTGGSGDDKFVFDTALDATTNFDKVTDFVSGLDKLVFDKTVFSAFIATGLIGVESFYSGAGVTRAHDATDRFVYNTTSGSLWYDADGNGTGKAVQVSVLNAHPELVFGDILIVA